MYLVYCIFAFDVEPKENIVVSFVYQDKQNNN